MRWVAGLMVVALYGTQMPMTRAQSTESAATITVPAGTDVPLKLISEIHNRSTKPGSSVRAQVAFPVMVGARVAIPADTYAEGTVLSVKALGPNHQPQVRMHFTRLVFGNGYTVPLDAENTQTFLMEPELGRSRATYQLADARDGMPMLGEGQTTPTTPSVPQAGPDKGVVIGATVGGMALVTVLAIVLSHRHATHADYVLLESGWQFEIELAQPLTLDTARIAVPANAQ